MLARIPIHTFSKRTRESRFTQSEQWDTGISIHTYPSEREQSVHCIETVILAVVRGGLQDDVREASEISSPIPQLANH